MSVLGTVIFCNSCGESSPEVQREFFIGSCGHVFCSLCMANYKNFCRICNCQCKILQINEQMPSEVKIFFEDKSISNQFQLIEKINTFQEKHVRLYVEKTQIYQQKYNKIKTEVMQLNKMKQEINETIKREQANMDKLRNAYRSGKITPNLFTLGSSSSSSVTLQEPSPGSSKGSPSQDIIMLPAAKIIANPTGPSPGNTPSWLQASPAKSLLPSPFSLNMSNNSNQRPSQQSDQHYSVNMRKSLLDTTLRRLHSSSQAKFQQLKREQLKKMLK